MVTWRGYNQLGGFCTFCWENISHPRAVRIYVCGEIPWCPLKIFQGSKTYQNHWSHCENTKENWDPKCLPNAKKYAKITCTGSYHFFSPLFHEFSQLFHFRTRPFCVMPSSAGFKKRRAARFASCSASSWRSRSDHSNGTAIDGRFKIVCEGLFGWDKSLIWADAAASAKPVKAKVAVAVEARIWFVLTVHF